MKENWKGLNSQEVQYRRALFSGCEGAEVNHQFSLTLDAQLSMFGHTYNPHTCHSTNYICNCHLYPYQQSYYILSIIKQQKYITSLPTMLLLTASLPCPPKELLKLRGQCWWSSQDSNQTLAKESKAQHTMSAQESAPTALVPKWHSTLSRGGMRWSARISSQAAWQDHSMFPSDLWGLCLHLNISEDASPKGSLAETRDLVFLWTHLSSFLCHLAVSSRRDGAAGGPATGYQSPKFTILWIVILSFKSVCHSINREMAPRNDHLPMASRPTPGQYSKSWPISFLTNKFLICIAGSHSFRMRLPASVQPSGVSSFCQNDVTPSPEMLEGLCFLQTFKKQRVN